MSEFEHWASVGYEQVTSLSAAAALTVPGKSRAALLQAEGQDIRWRDDGTDPTASVGFILKSEAEPFLYAGNLVKVRFIEETAGAKLNVLYVR